MADSQGNSDLPRHGIGAENMGVNMGVSLAIHYNISSLLYMC